VPRLRSVHRQMCLSLFWRGWRQALTLKRAEKVCAPFCRRFGQEFLRRPHIFHEQICKKNRTARRLRVLFSRWRDRFSRLGSLRLKWFNVDQRLHLNTLYHAFRGWHSMLVCLRFRRFAIQHSALARWRSRYLRLCGSRVAYQVLNAQYRAKTLGSSLLLWRILAWRQRVCRLFRQQRLLSVGSRLFFKWRTAARERRCVDYFKQVCFSSICVDRCLL
jgi:hypothetical protein